MGSRCSQCSNLLKGYYQFNVCSDCYRSNVVGMHKGMTGKIGPGSADLTLADYLERKGFFKEKAPHNDDHVLNKKKKLTFDEWWKINGIGGAGLHEIALEAWNAAQENK